MEFQLNQAERKKAKIKIGLQAPSGAGKTYSALLLAKGLCGDYIKVAVIDTENHSADLYSHLGNYNVLHLEAPFTPERYKTAIQVCEDAGMEVIIIDSISHEWEGTGGILEIHSNMTGNSFVNWGKLTPRHNQFIQKILNSNCHIISCIRSKQDYVLSEKNGKMVPEKVGLKGVTREGMDYEMTVVFDIAINHQAKASKDRTGIFDKMPEFIISEKIGQRISEWCNKTISVDEVKVKIQNSASTNQLSEVYNAYPEFRNTLLKEFQARKAQLTGTNSVTPKTNHNGAISGKQ
jgi:hypothetical protein